MKKLVLATHNANKVREIREILPDWEIDAEDSAAEETETTFAGNALLKARALRPRHPGAWILADDSGLEVFALGGAPGVRSARYAGEEGNTPKNNALLLKNLEGVEDRRAQFTCAIALVAPDGTERTVVGHCPGRILTAPAGAGGFGYDPLFVPDGHDRTFAELAPAEKNAISHRGRALAEAKKILLDVPSSARRLGPVALALNLFLAFAVQAGETRYVSSSAGSDAADGRTPATAWRSLRKLSADLPAGGTGLLKCGDTFFGEIKVKGGPDADHSTVITSYGAGAKPVLTFSKVLKDDPKIWQTGTGTVPLYGIWWCDLTNPTNYVGVDTTDINPGTLLVDGDLKPWRKFCWHDINRQWDFSAQGKYLFVYSTNNPALVSREIQVSLNEGAVDFVSNFVISNVTCRMIGSCAMCGGWNAKTVLRHVRVTDCDFRHIGGSALCGFEKGEFGRKVRFGNGVEFGHNVQDAIVERCTFDGVYDTAFTMQGMPTESWKDVHVRNCYFTNCTQAYELWCRNAPKGVGYERCSFTGNRCVGVGAGWGPETRPNRCVATPLLMYFMDADVMDIDLSNNVFENCPNGILYKLGGLDKLPKGYRVHDNIIK